MCFLLNDVGVTVLTLKLLFPMAVTYLIASLQNGNSDTIRKDNEAGLA